MAERNSGHVERESRSGHVPVLLEPSLDLLAIRPGGRYVDATFGGGGHSRAMLERSAPDGVLLALDADPDAVSRAGVLVNDFPNRLRIEHANFADLATVVKQAELDPLDGVLFDLGLSSFQFDELERGFSLRSETRLDMRLNPEGSGPNAWEIVNEWPEDEIASLIYRYGDESRSRRLARAIARQRENVPIETNADLAEVVQRSLGGRRGQRIHPATRTFQAIRIAVNRELEALESGLRGALDVLAPGGRLAVISFHSLEDRIVKQFFQLESRDCICPPGQPVCTCDHHASLMILTRRPVVPDEAEQSANPRSRSAKLRVAERIR